MTKHMTAREASNEFYNLTNALDVGTPSWDVVIAALSDIRNAAKRLQYLSERECNGVPGKDGHAKWDEKDQAQNDRWRELAERRVSDAMHELFDSETLRRIRVEFQHDPRGAPILVHVEDRERVATFW